MTATERPSAAGRPRDEAITEAIFDATFAVLTEHGFADFSMGEVAERAGVHKPAVYRRWPNKLELIAAVLQRMAFPLNDPASGDIRSDLVEMLVGAISGHPTPLPLQLRIRSEVVATPELAEAMDRLVFRPRRAMGRKIVRRAIAGGQLRADTRVDLVLDMLFGADQERAFAGGRHSRRDFERIVDLLLDGIRP